MVRDEDEMSGIFSDGDGVKLCVFMFFLLFFFLNLFYVLVISFAWYVYVAVQWGEFAEWLRPERPQLVDEDETES